MRNQGWVGVGMLAAITAVYGVVVTTAQAQADAKAATVVADVRKALGGEQKLGAVKGLSLRADYRREMSAGAGGGGTMTFVMMGGGGGNASGSQQTTGKIEIDVDLPDRYLRADIGSAAFGMTRTEGFDSSRPFPRSRTEHARDADPGGQPCGRSGTGEDRLEAQSDRPRTLVSGTHRQHTAGLQLHLHL